MRVPTPEQKVVLEDNGSRVRIVRAAPGSGKTWLVAEVITEELKAWQVKHAGVAALSFTRVGGEEIRKAVGYELGHPHFVGTIDSFLFRFVVRPFFQRIFTNYARPRLIPGEWGADYWKYIAKNQSTSVPSSQGKGKEINLFGCVFISETDNGEAQIAYKPYPGGPFSLLSFHDSLLVKEGKKEVWKSTGKLTHSDVALIASKILGHAKYGSVVRAEIVRRFPFIVVDELQDTGHFLGKSIRLILDEPTVRGLLVGDPDQAIYEFNGAKPHLFKTFEKIDGAVHLPLETSQRCPPAVACVASHLKDSGGKVGPAINRTGRALLVTYTSLVPDVTKIVKTMLASINTKSLKVITRGTSTVESLTGRHLPSAPNLYCPAITHMARAVIAFKKGRSVAALAAARASLERAVFECEGVDDEKLASFEVDPLDWKELGVKCLLKANENPTNGTFIDWQMDIGKMIDTQIKHFNLHKNTKLSIVKLKPQMRKGAEQPAAKYLKGEGSSSAEGLASFQAQTVHGVKGETHDVTIFVCPDSAESSCPSNVWWSKNDSDREEKRIAFVAMTRTRGDLIVCVSTACHERLLKIKPAFVEDFKCLTVEQCVAEFSTKTAI